MPARRPVKRGKPKKSASKRVTPAPVPVAVPVDDARPAAPAPVAAQPSPYRTAMIFALGLVVISALLFALVRETRPEAPDSKGVPQLGDPTFAELAGSEGFREWIKEWRKVDSYVSPAEFGLRDAGAITVVRPPVTPARESLLPPVANRYVWSPDRSRYVDYLASYGEPDSTVAVYDRLGDRMLETLSFCGTPCGFEYVHWLDNDRVAVFGSEESVREDGRPLCITSGDDVRRCYRRLTVTLYDFVADLRRTYVSGDHQFASNPFDLRSRDRWILGLSAEAKDAVGIAATGEAVIIRGAVVEYATDARVLAVGSGKALRFAVLALTAIVRDEVGDIVGHAHLRKGQEIEVNSVVGDDGTLVALGVRVLREPAIYLDAPTAGEEVGPAFEVRGTARVFEGTVRVRATNERTERVLLDSYATAAVEEVGRHAPFTFEADLPFARVRDGDAINLEVFQESAEDGSEIDKVILKLVYRQ